MQPSMFQLRRQLEADGVTIVKLTNELKLKDITINMLDTAWDQSIEALAAAQAEIARLAKINVKLCADFNLMNQHGAKQDTEIARLTAALATAREGGMREAAQVAVDRKGFGSDAALVHPYDKGYVAACDAIATAIRALATLQERMK